MRRGAANDVAEQRIPRCTLTDVAGFCAKAGAAPTIAAISRTSGLPLMEWPRWL